MKQIERVEPTEVFDVGGKYKRKVVVKHFTDDDGIAHEFTTFHEEGKRFCAAIAITKDDLVITSFQFRPGPERWMYELPGGAVEDGEDTLDAVKRELREETGYVAGSLSLLGEHSRDAYINAKWYYYLALDCEMSESGHERDQEEKQQGLEAQLITIDQLIDNAKTDRMTDPAAVLMAYDMLKKHMEGRDG